MVPKPESSVFDDLAAEHRRLDAILAGLGPDDWVRESGAPGWTISDVVLHLAQSEELVLATVGGERAGFVREEGVHLDTLMDRLVAADRGMTPEQVFERWRKAAAASPDALRNHPPKERLAWAAVPLSPRTLATTRLAEHWAHGLDITDPLGIDFPDTARLRHIAWLAQRTLPYAFATEGEEGGPVRCELTGPDGESWTFGDPGAPSVIRGPVGDFCRVGARRVAPGDTALVAEGPHAEAALRVVRNYAT
ncbi:maleylpyruvate isomerase family mycothiol-dependent enzyme [Spirillospora sp. CA-294931]|uniref:maleylpyruvate isomerase family mycothiol-dependent enzyme n=1 Tax=Spirillospora sp. CA-294931 TaxID=3240042 RepID=UPI003D89C403